jgi:hypothetical protein
VQIEQTHTGYDIYVEYRAEKTGKSEAEIRVEIGAEEFERQVRQLHTQWMSGEFSFGKFTELISIPHWELWQILETFDLPLHR